MVSIQLRAQDASLQIHVIWGFFPIQSSLPLSVFDDPFLAAFHGLNYERDIKKQHQIQDTAFAAATKTNEKNKRQSTGLFAVKT